MLMAMQDRNGVFRALHRTWLQPDGSAKAPVTPSKMMAGPAWGAAVWLSPWYGTAAEHAYAGEGGETMLSVQMALCDGEERRELGFYAVGSLGNLAGAGSLAAGARAPFHPDRLDAKGNRLRLPTEVPEMSRPGFLPPPRTRRITLCEDNDNKDQASAEALYRRAANRWAMMGLKVDRAKPRGGEDFNSMLAKLTD